MIPRVALVGNPNTGKTTLFNGLTGASVRVGNYPGVTVERSLGRLRGAATPVEILDVPGAYSLVARSAEERIAVDALLGRDAQAPPALVAVVLDATAVERNLYFATQILELGGPTVVILNQVDQAARQGITVDAEALAARLGVPVLPTVGTDAAQVAALGRALEAWLAAPPPAPAWPWPLEGPLAADAQALAGCFQDAPPAARQALALWALGSVDPEDPAWPAPLRAQVAARLATAEGAGRDVDLELARARYAWIDALTPACVQRAGGARLADRVDRLLLHPVLGFAAFLAAMILVFQALFAGAEPFTALIEGLVGRLAGALRAALPEGLLADFLADAALGGVGNVLVFLPQIALLFVLIGLMEDSGYMARVAFLMDRIMRRVGLHGRAFVPLLSGFACAIPAVLATRTLERRRDRLLTMLVLPLMTCSARLPVYTLIIAATVPAATVWGIFSAQSLVMLGLYLFATAVALLAAAVLGRTVLRGGAEPLLLELPDYRIPSPRSVARLVWRRSGDFVREAGTVILVFTALMWALAAFPRAPDGPSDPVAAQAAQAEQSYAGQLGRALTPLTEPLGFDWRTNVAVIGAFAAREVFVSTLGVIYGLGGDGEDQAPLRQRMAKARHPDGRPVHTPRSGLALLVFFALACQCMSTIVVVRRESGSWRWPAFMFAYMTALAWLAAFCVYQGGALLGLS